MTSDVYEIHVNIKDLVRQLFQKGALNLGV